MVVRRGDLYLLKRDTLGKQRPIVIISRDQLNGGHSVLAVPFYSQQLDKRRREPFCAFFQAGEGGLSKDCVAKADQVSLIDKSDIDLAAGRIGRFNSAQMERIVRAVRYAIRDDEAQTP